MDESSLTEEKKKKEENYFTLFCVSDAAEVLVFLYILRNVTDIADYFGFILVQGL